MDERELLKKHGGDAEQRQLLARVLDLQRLAEKRYKPCCTGFLTPAEQAFLQRIPELGALSYEGGYASAERRMAVITPEYCDETITPAVLALENRGDRLSHRDILGAVMALGIKRDRVGDILDSCTPQIIICDETVAEFIISELKRAGRAGVTVRRGEIGEIPEAEVTLKTATVASLRLDSVVAEGFAMSRTRAAELIKSGAAELNWTPCDSASAEVFAGDRISLRGCGKIELREIGNQSRKGRTFITIARY